LTTQSVFDFSLPELSALLEQWGHPTFRAKQLWHALYVELVSSFDEISAFPKALRQTLNSQLKFGSLQLVTSQKSRDGSTQKILFALPDGKQIETVLMGYDERRTVCFSTQAGCAMGCVFCATGQMGFERNLTIGEIIEQILWFARQQKQTQKPLTNLVAMGMGEPFHNYRNVMAALDLTNEPHGFNFGARRVTVSTVGLVPGLKKFTAEGRRENLAVSLHAASEDLRSELVPMNARFSLAEILSACREYVHTSHRRITFEWALIQHKNDSLEQANLLAQQIQDILCHVNIIPLNPTQDYAGAAATAQSAEQFKEVLARYEIPCTVRVRRGIDIAAGCGQLRKTQASLS
jgi:23S rRNA (adenine2503-C2)-methyltransferase